MENELVMGTDAYKNGNIVYLAHPAVWYTAEGGITALDHYAAGSGEQAAGLSPANNRKGRDTYGYPAPSSSSTPRRPVL